MANFLKSGPPFPERVFHQQSSRDDQLLSFADSIQIQNSAVPGLQAHSNQAKLVSIASKSFHEPSSEVERQFSSAQHTTPSHPCLATQSRRVPNTKGGPQEALFLPASQSRQESPSGHAGESDELIWLWNRERDHDSVEQSREKARLIQGSILWRYRGFSAS